MPYAKSPRTCQLEEWYISLSAACTAQQRQDSFYQCAMKMGKHSKKRPQQQSGSGRAVLLTFYVVRPRRKDGGGASTAHHHHHDVHHHHHHHLYHHVHGRSSDESRRGSDRRADLLEYSRQLRATSATTKTPPHPKPPLPPRRDIQVIKPASAVRHDDRPAGDDDRRLVRERRLERAASLQEVRYSCLGYGGDWNWKKVLKLVLPCQGNGTGHQASTRSKKRRDSADDNDSKKNSKQARAWPAAVQLVSKLKVNKVSRKRTSSKDDEGLMKKLFSMFRQQPRPSP